MTQEKQKMEPLVILNTDEIKKLFDLNIKRVNSLIATYSSFVEAKQNRDARGRRAVTETDTLRAAVIFLHSSLEEVMRGLAMLLWPIKQDSEFFSKNIPLYSLDGSSKNRPEKFSLGDLFHLKEKTVNEIYIMSIHQYIYSKYTVNDIGQLKADIDRLGITLNISDVSSKSIAAFFARRHTIVHHADRNTLTGQGNHKAKSIKAETVNEWKNQITSIVYELLIQSEIILNES